MDDGSLTVGHYVAIAIVLAIFILIAATEGPQPWALGGLPPIP